MTALRKSNNITPKEEQPYLQPESKTMLLHPVSSLDLDPPIQMFWLYNRRDVATNFFIDMEPFEQLKRDNYGHSVIECLTPTGTVDPKSWTPIKIRFSPLEYTEYTVMMLIIPDSSTGMSLQVPIEGITAFNTNVWLRPMASSEWIRSFVPCGDKLPITLSPTHITFNHFICTGQTVSSCVFLTNVHKENSMSFQWPETTIEGGGSIQFEPDCGRIPPGGEVSCRVVVKAGSVAVTFTAAIRCVIIDEGTKAIHQFVLNKWEKEYRKSNLIDSEEPNTILKNQRHKLHRAPKLKPAPPEPFSQLLSVSMYIGSVFGLFDAVPDREKTRMPFPGSVEVNPAVFPLGEDGHGVLFSKFEREISEDVILELLWDITQGSNFETMVRQATKRKAPLYEEYKESEKMRHGEQQKGIDHDLNRNGSVKPLLVDPDLNFGDVNPVVADPEVDNGDLSPVVADPDVDPAVDPDLHFGDGHTRPVVVDDRDLNNGDGAASPAIVDNTDLNNGDVNEEAADSDPKSGDENASPTIVESEIKTEGVIIVAVDRDPNNEEASIIDPDQDVKLCRRQLEEIMEASLFNLIQEMSAAYLNPKADKNKWFDLPPVQPQAFVDIEKYKNRL